MIYRFYKIVEPYISETIQKSIHDHNVKNPQYFIYDNHFDKIQHERVKAFKDADEVLEFEKTEGFICWLYPEHRYVIKRNITNTDQFVYLLSLEYNSRTIFIPKEEYDLETNKSSTSYISQKRTDDDVLTFEEFIQKFPNEPILSWNDFLALDAKYAPKTDPILDDKELLEKIDDAVVVWEENYRGKIDESLPLPKNTYKFDLQNVVVTDKGYVYGKFDSFSKIDDAMNWYIGDEEHISNFMTIHKPNVNYRIVPKLTIHALINEISIEDIVKNIEILKSYVAV
jgi:hypothetical protein